MGPPTWAFIGRWGLREVVLWLLSDRPKNGAEVTRAVEVFTWDFWKSFLSSVSSLLGLGLELIIGYRVARIKNIAVNLTQSLYARRRLGMLRPQVVPRSAILPLLLLITTAMLLLSASSTTNAEIIYKPGDWLLYRFTFNYSGWECTYLYQVAVKKIIGTKVLYTSWFEKKEKGDNPIICGVDIPIPVRIEVPWTSDISKEEPGPWRFFINPAYTGEYKIDKTTYRYYKGILTYLEERREITGMGLTLTRMELIDTSIPELKALIAPSGMSMIGLILIVVLATIITVIAMFIVVRRRRKTTETPLNQSQAT